MQEAPAGLLHHQLLGPMVEQLPGWDVNPAALLHAHHRPPLARPSQNVFLVSAPCPSSQGPPASVSTKQGPAGGMKTSPTLAGSLTRSASADDANASEGGLWYEAGAGHGHCGQALPVSGDSPCGSVASYGPLSYARGPSRFAIQGMGTEHTCHACPASSCSLV